MQSVHQSSAAAAGEARKHDRFLLPLSTKPLPSQMPFNVAWTFIIIILSQTAVSTCPRFLFLWPFDADHFSSIVWLMKSIAHQVTAANEVTSRSCVAVSGTITRYVADQATVGLAQTAGAHPSALLLCSGRWSATHRCFGWRFFLLILCFQCFFIWQRTLYFVSCLEIVDNLFLVYNRPWSCLICSGLVFQFAVLVRQFWGRFSFSETVNNFLLTSLADLRKFSFDLFTSENFYSVSNKELCLCTLLESWRPMGPSQPVGRWIPELQREQTKKILLETRTSMHWSLSWSRVMGSWGPHWGEKSCVTFRTIEKWGNCPVSPRLTVPSPAMSSEDCSLDF